MTLICKVIHHNKTSSIFFKFSPVIDDSRHGYIRDSSKFFTFFVLDGMFILVRVVASNVRKNWNFDKTGCY